MVSTFNESNIAFDTKYDSPTMLDVSAVWPLAAKSKHRE